MKHLTAGRQKLLIVSLDALLLLLFLCRNAVLGFMLGSESQCFMLEKGWICPACGGTRCAFYFASGEFAKAFSYHPVMFCIFIYLAVLLIFWNLELLLKWGWAKKLRKIMADYRAIIAVALCYVVIGMSRNFVGDWSHLYQ